MSIEQRVLAAIKPYVERDEPVDYATIAAAAGVSHRQVYHAVKNLRTGGSLFLAGRQSLYRFSLCARGRR